MTSVSATQFAPRSLDHSEKATRATRSDARIRQLLNAATTLMVRKGSHEVSMQAIADEAGVSVGLIYRYFSNKLELVQAVIVDVLDDVASRLPEAVGTVHDPVRRIAVAFEAYCRIMDERRDAAVLTYRETMTLDREGRQLTKNLEIQTAQPLRDAISDAVDAELLRPVNPELLAMDLLMRAHSWALKHWFYQPRMTFEEFVYHERSTVLSGIVLPEHRADYADLISGSA